MGDMQKEMPAMESKDSIEGKNMSVDLNSGKITLRQVIE